MMDPDSCCNERTCATLNAEKHETSFASKEGPSVGDVPALIPASQNRIEQYSSVATGQSVTPAVRTNLLTQAVEHYNRLHDRQTASSTTCGPCRLSSRTICSMQTKGSQPENDIGNGNYCTQGVRRFGVNVEATHHSQNSSKNCNEERFRNVIGQETMYTPNVSTAVVVESAPQEGKKSVRPPLVGQASACDNSTGVQDMLLPAVSNTGAEDNSDHSVQEDLLQHTYAEKETDYSGAIKETQLHKAFGSGNSSTEDKDLKLYSCSQGKGDKTEACRDVKVLCEIKEDFVCGRAAEARDCHVSGRMFMAVPFPADPQYQTYMSSSQNQDNSAVATEAVGSGRAPSPASVSSVTSSRRLEWDSGADVGYQNYQPENGESSPNEGLSTIERIALARGCSAALRLEPEGTSGSVQQLNTVQFKPVAKSSKFVCKMPLAVSTPVECGQRVASCATGTDSESEIIPDVQLQAERCIFHGEEHSCHLAEKKSTSVVQQKVPSLQIKGQESCSAVSSLRDLRELGHPRASKNLLCRSQSYQSLFSKEDHKTKAFQDSNNGSYPLRHQHKRNSGLTACSLSSSSVSTVVPNNECTRIPDKPIEISAFHVPVRNSIGIRVSETEKVSKSLCATPNCNRKYDDSALKHVAVLNPEQEIMLEGTDSDIIDKTDSAVEDTRTAEHNPKHMFVLKQNYVHVSKVQPQKQSYQEIKPRKLLPDNTKIENGGSAFCKGVQKRRSIECQWGLSANGAPQKLTETSKGKLNIDISKPSLERNQSEEDSTEKNSGTLDSVTSSTQTAGSWFLGETPQSTNENQNVSGRRGSSGVVGSANSFEYLPGHVYENNALALDKNLYRNTTAGCLFTESASSQPLASFADNKFEANNDKSWGSSVSSSFIRDIEKGISVLKNLLNAKSYNSDKKKKLMRQVVNRLIETSDAEGKVLLESNIAWVPPKSHAAGYVNGQAVQEASQEVVSGGHKMRRTMERGEVSGESGSEQHGGSNPRLHKTSLVADRGAQSVLSEASGPSSLSESRADSRAETTTSTTQGHAGSSSTNSTFPRNWKELTTQSEREYEQCRHKPGRQSIKSVLLSLCETERESQLSWICTEIRHLNNLKQLLEKQKKLGSDLMDLEIQTYGGTQKKRRDPVSSQKSSEVSAEPESVRSDGTDSSSIREAHLKEIEIGRNRSVRADRFKHIKPSMQLMSPKVPEKHSGTDKFTVKVHQNSSDSDMKTVVSNRKDVFTQFPTSAKLCNIKINDKLRVEEKGIQAPTSSNVSTNGDTYELIGGVLSDSTASGRINVFMQTRGKKLVTKEDSQRSQVINKNIAEASKSNEFRKATVKQSELNQSTPLCCCECKKLLGEISSDLRSTKQRSVGNSVEGHMKMNSLVDKQEYDPSSGRTTQSKNADNSSARSCTFSSSGTLGDAIELTHDSDHVQTSVATETTGNTGVQTTQPLSSLPLIRPQWYSLVSQGTQKLSSKVENGIDASHKKCPCCGTSEDKTDTILISSHSTAGEWKCYRCLKKEQDKRHNRKCQICGVLESEQNGIADCDTVWKCSDCLAKLLDKGKPVLDKSIQCGLRKGCENVKEKQGDDGTSSSNTTMKAPVGYVVTIETTTDSVSSVAEKSEKKPLEEIRIKVPVKNRRSISSKRKEKENLKTGFSKSGMKSSKQKQKPVGSTENRSATDCAAMRNKHYSREHTLQEYLAANRPDFIQSAEYRRQCLDELSYLRELRQKSRLKLLALASSMSHFDGDSTELISTGPLPPPPLAVKRIFSQRTMRAQTERKYHNLPEVLNKKVDRKRKEDYRTNRLMAEIFARKLQKRVLKGDVNLSNSRSVISNI